MEVQRLFTYFQWFSVGKGGVAERVYEYVEQHMLSKPHHYREKLLLLLNISDKCVSHRRHIKTRFANVYDDL